MNMKYELKLLVGIASVGIVFFIIRKVMRDQRKEAFKKRFYSEPMQNEKKSNGTKEGFVTNQCPTTMIKKGNQILLYNPKLAKIPGVNPILLKSLSDYKEYVAWQRANKINCPILHLERMYDTQGNEQYDIKPSFLLNQPQGALNHDLPVVHKTQDVNELLNAHNDNNSPYNQNSFPSFDPYNQNVGTFTQHDVDGPNPQLRLNQQ
jgi:hypothetical protein